MSRDQSQVFNCIMGDVENHIAIHRGAMQTKPSKSSVGSIVAAMNTAGISR